MKNGAVLNTIAFGLLLFVILGFLIGGYFYFFHENPPIEIYNEPLPISPAVVRPGETVLMASDYCKWTDAPASLSLYWQRKSDGLIWGLQQSVSNIAGKGDCFKVSIPLTIPPNLPPGEWRRVNIGTYHVNPLVARSVEWHSDYVTVTGK